LIQFSEQIPSTEWKTDFAQKIIDTESSGVLNWVIRGLERLVAKGRLDAPDICRGELDQIRIETDPLAGFLGEGEYKPKSETREYVYLPLKDMHSEFKDYCDTSKNNVMSKITFSRRLKGMGFCVEKKREGTVVRVAVTNKNNNPDPSEG
jgi:putative DNA primase/helicase